MDLEQVQRLAQAFAQGVAFARGFTEMAQDAKDGEEEGHWVTIGGERGADGEKHGGRPVFISGSGTIKKGLSRSAQGKTLGQVFGKGGEFSSEGKKSKPAQQRNESFREMARRHSEQKAAEAEREAGRSAEEKDKAAQLSNKLNMGLFSYYDGLSYAADNLDRKAAKALADKAGDNEALQNALRSIRSTVRTSKMFMRDYYQRIVDAAGKGKIDNARAAKEFDKYKSLSAKVADIADSAMDQIGELKRLNHDKVAQAITELSRQNETIQDTIRGQVQGLENANTPKTHTYSAKDPLYAARGKVINGPARTSTTARATRATPEQIADKVRQATDRVQARMVKATRPVTERIDNGFVIQGPASEVERIRNGIRRIGTRLSSGEGMVGSACMAVEDAAYNGIIDQERAKSELNKIRETADRYAEIARKVNKFMNQAKTMRVDTAVSARRIRQAEKTVNELYQSLDKQIDEINYSERKARGYVR